jgi:hypothetical protein
MTRVRMDGRSWFKDRSARLIKALEDDESFVEFRHASGSFCWLNPRAVRAVTQPAESLAAPSDSVEIAIL